ncbi:protein of unknown function [Methylacidimicrobium sp. AP8]|nr:protein of unknown function [Methylacidimicrobium sp. AP8]
MPPGTSHRTDKTRRKPPLLLGTMGGIPAWTNGRDAAKAAPSPPNLFGLPIERLTLLAGWAVLAASFFYLAVKAVPVLAAPSWWQADGAAVRLAREAATLVEGARALAQEEAVRTRLAPLMAAVAFSSVPTLLVDEAEILAPLPKQPGRVRIQIRSYDADGMGALATFGAMVAMGFERSTGKKVRLNPTGLKIPYALDAGSRYSPEPIRATLTAPLRWEEWQ